ncbi:hypothetical protein K456DRAFT_571853 [Colletotrichum gloeosporioides 23]|nr:hypothetical protein K456DRAFT_571853 [Colletotrichum gloeosporioides 23]
MALDHQFLMPDDTSVMSGDPPLPTSSNIPANIKFYHEVAGALPDTMEWYGNALHTAIIQRDQVKLVEILKKDTVRAILWEKDAFGYTSLQLLASWPVGIELLLFYWGPQSLRVDNREGLPMLSYALYSSKEICSVSSPARCPHTCACADTVAMLLEADCLIELNSTLVTSMLDASMRCQELMRSRRSESQRRTSSTDKLKKW